MFSTKNYSSQDLYKLSKDHSNWVVKQPDFFNTLFQTTKFEKVIYNIKRKQILDFFETLSKRVEIIEIEKIVDFLSDQKEDFEQIVDIFLFIYKSISTEFANPLKIVLQKYHDPETNDIYISVDVRQKEYPEFFIEKIWKIRDIFTEKHYDNDWILITTDYKPYFE